jgi:hypothetical protein
MVGAAVEIGVGDAQIAGVKVGGGANVLAGVAEGTSVFAAIWVGIGVAVAMLNVAGGSGVIELLIDGVSDGGGVMLAVERGVSVTVDVAVDVAVGINVSVGSIATVVPVGPGGSGVGESVGSAVLVMAGAGGTVASGDPCAGSGVLLSSDFNVHAANANNKTNTTNKMPHLNRIDSILTTTSELFRRTL